MAIISEDRVILRHILDGRDLHNAPEITTILTYDESTDSKLLYRVGRTRPGCNNGRPFDLEAFDTAEDAEQYAAELADWSRGEYEVEDEERRATRAQALRSLASTWWRDDPARQAVEALAAAIEAGTEGAIVEALEAFDPIPSRRRTDDARRGRRQAQHAG